LGVILEFFGQEEIEEPISKLWLIAQFCVDQEKTKRFFERLTKEARTMLIEVESDSRSSREHKQEPRKMLENFERAKLESIYEEIVQML
jgi:hypothetical protein